MTLPIKAMVACLALLNPKAPVCEDAKGQMFLCVDDKCATIQSLSLEWRRHPRKQIQTLRKIYGQQEK